MPTGLEGLLRAAGLVFRRIDLDHDTGFLLHELPESAAVSGISQTSGLFLLAESNAEALLAAAAPGAQFAESGTLRLGDREVPIHRYVKLGEPSSNLERRAAWFQKRVT